MWGSQFCIVLFQQCSYATGLQAFKEISPEQNCNKQLGPDLVFPGSVSKEAALGRNQLRRRRLLCSSPGCGYFPGLLFPWPASAHPAASVSDMSGPSTPPAGLLCGIGAIIQKGAVPQSEKSRPWPSFCGLDAAATAYAPIWLAVLGRHSEGDNYEASGSHSWSHVKVLTGLCA